jgi:hypothetical protein
LADVDEVFRWEATPVVRPDFEIFDCPEVAGHEHPDKAVAELLDLEKCKAEGYIAELGSKSHSRRRDDTEAAEETASGREINAFDQDVEEIEETDRDLPYYAKYFSGGKHLNFLCDDPDHGPLCLTFERNGTGSLLHKDPACPPHNPSGGCKAILRSKTGMTR